MFVNQLLKRVGGILRGVTNPFLIFGVLMKNYVEALLVERASYERRGLKDRVKAVDSALREVGFDHKYMSDEIETAAIEPVVERAVIKPAKKRRA